MKMQDAQKPSITRRCSGGEQRRERVMLTTQCYTHVRGLQAHCGTKKTDYLLQNPTRTKQKIATHPGHHAKMLRSNGK